MSYRVGVVTGTRAEYGLLKPLIKRISESDCMSAIIIATGNHFSEAFGNTYKEIEEDGYKINYRVPMDLEDSSNANIVNETGKELSNFSKVLKEANLDLMVVLGDRYEILSAVFAATIFRIPVAHIHGGEVTEGAFDNGIRHAITKLSQLHFAATEEYANRIIQMGESPENVYNVGALGVENILNLELLSRDSLIEKYGNLFRNNYVLVTYHPETLSDVKCEKQIADLLSVIEKHNEYNYIFTYANADPGGMIINKEIDRFVLNHANCMAMQSMGSVGYLSALKYAKMVVGNSSSGIIEAPTFNIPVINIGYRQKGRVKAKCVIDCLNNNEDIERAFELSASEEFANICCRSVNPYKNKNTSKEIYEIIKKY